jgi:hypothetical protein
MRGRFTAVLAVALVAVVALPATAFAAKKVSVNFSAKSSHGYRLHFFAKGKPGRMLAFVQVSRLTNGRKAYEAVSSIGDRGTSFRNELLESDVGDAKVAVRFEPSTKPGCAGTFVGKIRYRGDHGFTKASLDSAKGRLRINGECPQRSMKRRAVPVDASLVACGNGARSSLSYIVYRPRPRQAAHLTTRYEVDSRHEQTIRDMGTLEPAKTFVAAPDLLSATVEPHTLYSGSGGYADGVLTGDLKANLPGRIRPDRLTPLSAALGPGEVTSDCSAVAAGARAAKGVSGGIYGRYLSMRSRSLP